MPRPRVSTVGSLDSHGDWLRMTLVRAADGRVGWRCSCGRTGFPVKVNSGYPRAAAAASWERHLRRRHPEVTEKRRLIPA